MILLIFMVFELPFFVLGSFFFWKAKQFSFQKYRENIFRIPLVLQQNNNTESFIEICITHNSFNTIGFWLLYYLLNTRMLRMDKISDNFRNRSHVNRHIRMVTWHTYTYYVFFALKISNWGSIFSQNSVFSENPRIQIAMYAYLEQK